jgi:hypothetical protein
VLLTGSREVKGEGGEGFYMAQTDRGAVSPGGFQVSPLEQAPTMVHTAALPEEALLFASKMAVPDSEWAR